MSQFTINMMAAKCIYFRESHNHNLKFFNKERFDLYHILLIDLHKGIQGGTGQPPR